MDIELLKDIAAILGLILIAVGILAVLLKDKFQRPTVFVTDHDFTGLKEIIQRLQSQVDKMDSDVRTWREEIRENCATDEDVTKMGEKMSAIQSFHMTVHDNGLKALNRSARAYSEAKRANAAVEVLAERTDRRLEALDKKMDELPERIFKILGGRRGSTT